MTVIKTCKATGRSFIQFKTATPLNSFGGCIRAQLYITQVMKKVMKESIEFTGLDITTVFRKPTGEFKLYSKHYIINSHGDMFYWIGVDTENCKGWSLRIVKLDDDAAHAVIASGQVFEIAY